MKPSIAARSFLGSIVVCERSSRRARVAGGRAARVALSLAVALVSAACKEEGHEPPLAPRERSQAVQATGPDIAAASPSPAPSVVNAAASAGAKPHRALCAGELRDGRALPKKHVSQAVVADARALPENLPVEGSGFTWVNFWAAWCAPCKEEIPRLVKWEKDLTKAGAKFRVVFVSLDDDERQLRQFLEASSSLRATYWLKEGNERNDWLKGAGLDGDPELPIHLLVDAHGRVRCKVQGAVDDADFADLRRLLASHSASD